ncbi:MAG: hypothetical protein WBA16_07625 [Nonlabens sp.]
MKYVGFITEIEEYFIPAKERSEYLGGTLSAADRRVLIQYLNIGLLCVPLMGTTENPFEESYDPEDMDSFTKTEGYLAIHTDGYYLWPQYFKEFLETGHITSVDQEFLEHTKSAKPKDLSENQILEMESDFYKEHW